MNINLSDLETLGLDSEASATLGEIALDLIPEGDLSNMPARALIRPLKKIRTIIGLVQERNLDLANKIQRIVESVDGETITPEPIESGLTEKEQLVIASLWKGFVKQKPS